MENTKMLMQSELYKASVDEKVMNTEIEGERLVGEGVKFQRIRRITGYLVGTLDRFNNAKLSEVRDRVKHG
ncbi:MAG: hypothetical protein IKO41_14175 [Lachnospiraceae bacterium]|nr:hypothetical protein [Lachnospiraceae bacterium]